MKDNTLSFSIENILKNDEKETEQNYGTKLQGEEIVKTIEYQPAVQWNSFILHDHSSNITSIVNLCGTYLDNVTRDCNCKNGLKSPKNFPEKLKIRRIGHPYQSRAPPKRKPCRNTFNHSQVIQLEQLFQKAKYLSSSERTRVAKELNMTDNQLKTWYQNRRTKLKREINEMKEEQQRLPCS